MTRRLLITGASGRIGSLVIPTLLREKWSVVTAGRVGCDISLDLASSGSIAALRPDLERVHTVLHLAAIAHRAADPALIDRVNRAGSLALIDVAKAAGVARFIAASSILAEADDPYGRAKAAMERHLDAVYGRGGLALRFAPVLLPPPAGNLAKLVQLAAKGWPSPFGAVEALRSFASPHSVIGAVKAALNSQDMSGIVGVADREPLAVKDLMAALRASLGKGGRDWPVPPSVLRALLPAHIAAALIKDHIVDVSAMNAQGADLAQSSLHALSVFANSKQIP